MEAIKWFTLLLDTYSTTYTLDTVQGFLCELGMKPNMRRVEIIFSVHLVIVRLNKFMNRSNKKWAHFLENKVIKKENYKNC